MTHKPSLWPLRDDTPPRKDGKEAVSKRKKRKKRKKTVQQTQPQAKKTTREPSQSPVKSKTAYHLNRTQDSINKGDIPSALRWLGQLWPRQTEQFPVERMQWLMEHWQTQAQREWREFEPSVWESPSYLRFLREKILAFTTEEWRQLQTYGTPFLNEGQRLRDAFALLEQGQEDEARAQLKYIGLRSPFRTVRMFLRGLGAYYARRDNEALQAFEKLPMESVYARMVQPLLPFLQGETPSSVHTKTNPSMSQEAETSLDILALWGETEFVGSLQLEQCLQLFTKQKLNQALSQLRRLWPSLNDRLQRIIYQELPGTLQATGIKKEILLQRLFKTIPPDPQDPKQYRLQALLAEEEQKLTKAIECWELWFASWKRGDFLWPTPNRSLSEALYHHHIGILFRHLAEASEEEYEYGWYSQRTSPQAYWKRAKQKLEAAIELEPTLERSWITLWNVTIDLEDSKEADRILERALKVLPDNCEFLAAAADACYERKAYDKGLRYVRRALKVNPLNKELHILQDKFLIQKARKKYHQGKADDALKLYREASDSSHIPTPLKIQHAAEQTMFHLLQKQPEQAAESWQDTEDLPWMARGYFWQAGHLLTHKKKKQKQKIPALSLAETVPSSPPTEEEIRALLDLYENDQFPYTEQRFWRGQLALMQQAFTQAPQHLSKHDDFEIAEHILSDPMAKLKILELAQQSFPNCDHFVIDRYEKAMECQMPPAYFADATEELQAHNYNNSPLASLRRILFDEDDFDEDDFDEDDFDEDDFPLFMAPLSRRRSPRITNLLAKIKRYVKKNSKPPKAKKQQTSQKGRRKL